jgi:HK97 family phage portal protein
MANPFKLAQTKAVEALEGKSQTDLTWYGDMGWSSVFGGGDTSNEIPHSFERLVKDAFRKNPVVRACVQEIATSISEAPIRAYTDEADGKRLWIPEHPVEELFEQPNARDSYVEFIERAIQHYFIGGNTFIRKIRSPNRRIVSLSLIRPDKVVTADVGEDGFPVNFKIREGVTSKVQTIPARDIIHIPDTDPLNEIFGLPRILAALTEIQADNEATLYVSEVLHNHGSPGTVVAVDSDKIRGQHLLERAEAKWEQKFGPGAGRGKVAFLPGAHTVKEIGFNLKDLEFKAMRDVARSSICAVFGIDPMILGLSSRGGTMSGNEHKEARRKLWMQTLIPMIRRWEGAINAFLAPDFGNIRAGFDLTKIEALQENRNERIERAREMSRTGVATVQEIREEMQFDSDVPDGAIIVIGGRIEYADPNDLLVDDDDEEETITEVVEEEEEDVQE